MKLNIEKHVRLFTAVHKCFRDDPHKDAALNLFSVGDLRLKCEDVADVHRLEKQHLVDSYQFKLCRMLEQLSGQI
jgi:hypothetical protein